MEYSLGTTNEGVFGQVYRDGARQAAYAVTHVQCGGKHAAVGSLSARSGLAASTFGTLRA